MGSPSPSIIIHVVQSWQFLNKAKPSLKTTSYPGPLRGSEALVREAKALVNTGHVCPKILDIFVTWPY
jgi:hypothetical protein